ncbi:site-specific DNA-methyltransferase [Pseudogemmobacter bohemicus]|uniref:site-specific DNA-methyltransferase n=1 Tax=Pseudogemmobacter bohemicus TaxID=2250708 RepID=UPI000DD43144|nr:site-specific DNA-methyltransferase [Pseudogemmobacter bohemicus]
MAKKPIEVETLTHDATRKNIPTAEFESLMRDQDKTPIQLAYERRNRDLDPQLVWRGKDEQDWSDLIVQAPPLYIQEKVHPKVIIDDLKRESANRAKAAKDAPQFDMFADFNGLPDAEAATEFYQHDQHWSNRMISGDSLSVMASLAEREGLRGQVQCIYFDPPYGIKFNSNFQWSTTSRDVKDGDKTHVTREPEQVRAFRDTWKDGIHSYLTYLRDRLTVARDLLSDSGSIFVQIGDENVHRVRALMDEVFGDDNNVSQITFKKTGGQSSGALANVVDFILWYSKSASKLKYRQLFDAKNPGDEGATNYTWIETEIGERRPLTAKEKRGEEPIPDRSKIMQPYPMFSDGPSARDQPMKWRGSVYEPSSNSHWKTHTAGLKVVAAADRFVAQGKTLRFVNYLEDYNVTPLFNIWTDTQTSGFGADRLYVVQTLPKVVERCILMTTDPGDLVLDPTCGSGTTAYVAEQWGRRWITIDTSRVAIALARSRLMGARYPYYLLADSVEGQQKEAEVTRSIPKSTPTHGSIRQGFVYDRVPHITLKSIANNAEIDVIWDRLQPAVEDAIATLNAALAGHPTQFKVETGGRAGAKIDFTATGQVKLPSGEMAPANSFMEWEIPREAPSGWPATAQAALKQFWEARIARQREIDASISAKAEFEYLYDKPFSDNGKTRVAGPFTVESLSPHRTLAVDWDDELIDTYEAAEGKRKAAEAPRDFTDFAHMILENLKAAGVQQAHKEDRITFTSLKGWPGNWIAAEGTFMEGDTQRRAGVFIGPEFGTVSRPDLVAAAREAGDAGFDVLIACAFNYDAHSSEFDKLGRIRILKARMNPDLHMGGDLKTTGVGNLFVIFGEPDIRITAAGDGMVQVQVFGVDVFKPQTGEVQSEGTDGIALWMLDTDYNEESFFVRHAYFLGANDPYKALKTTLKAEIDEEAWESLYSDTSRPFAKPKSGRIAVKVINHLGDEVMKVFAVE